MNSKKVNRTFVLVKKIILLSLVFTSKSFALTLEDSNCQWKPFLKEQYKNISESIYYELKHGFKIGCRVEDGKVFNSEGAYADIEMHNIPINLPEYIEYKTCGNISNLRIYYAKDLIQNNSEVDSHGAYKLDIEADLDQNFETVKGFYFHVHYDGYNLEPRGPIFDRKLEKVYFSDEIASFSCHK